MVGEIKLFSRVIMREMKKLRSGVEMPEHIGVISRAGQVHAAARNIFQKEDAEASAKELLSALGVSLLDLGSFASAITPNLRLSDALIESAIVLRAVGSEISFSVNELTKNADPIHGRNAKWASDVLQLVGRGLLDEL